MAILVLWFSDSDEDKMDIRLVSNGNDNAHFETFLTEN